MTVKNLQFVEGILAAFEIHNPLNKFSLTLAREIDEARVNGWILHSLEHNVSDLKLRPKYLVFKSSTHKYRNKFVGNVSSTNSFMHIIDTTCKQKLTIKKL